MRYVLTILALALVLGLLGGLKAAQISTLIGFGQAAEKAGPPPEAVGTAIAQEQTWENTIRAIANVASQRGVELSNEVAGTVTRLHFNSGSVVKAGQLLVELDANVERAQLASAIARRKLAEVSLARSQKLVSSGAVSQSQLDADQSAFDSLNAEAQALQAQIARKVIRAPFAGRLGIRMVNLGQYLQPGTAITVLESKESVFIDFRVPQQDLGTVKEGFPVRVSSETGEALGTGTVSAIDPALDEATRSVRIRATADKSSEAALRPGMFVNVEVVLPEKRKVVAIPITAVVRATYGDSVFRVEPGKAPDGRAIKVARQQFVKLDGTRGDFAAIIEGIKPGEEIVTVGAFKLRNGIPIAVNNAVKPKTELTPRPENR